MILTFWFCFLIFEVVIRILVLVVNLTRIDIDCDLSKAYGPMHYSTDDNKLAINCYSNLVDPK